MFFLNRWTKALAGIGSEILQVDLDIEVVITVIVHRDYANKYTDERMDFPLI